jgi:hypothetical protein
MHAVGHMPPRYIITNSLRWLRPLLLAIFGSLLLAASAHGAEVGGETQQQGTPGQEVPLEGELEKPAEAPTEVVEEPVEAPAESVEAPAESVEAPVEGAEKPAETPPAEPAGAPPAPETENTAEASASEGGEDAAGSGLDGERGAAGGGSEKAVGAAPPAPGGEQHETISSEAGETPAASPVPYSLPQTLSSVGERQRHTSSAQHEGREQTNASAAAAGGLGCVPSALEERIYTGCTKGSLGGAPVLAVRTGSLTAAAAALTGAGGSSDNGDRGGSANAAPPANPAPAGPSGSGSGASAGGAGGFGMAGFLAFALVLLLGIPHAVRRLRLSRERWHTAFFVLIAERPD